MALILIDDDDLEPLVLRRHLTKLGFAGDLTVFEYADDAIEFLRGPARPNIRLILCDINLPRMNGFEFADAFYALYPELRAETQLYLISGSIDPRDAERSEAHPGTAGFLKKPLSRDTLARLLREGGLLDVMDDAS